MSRYRSPYASYERRSSRWPWFFAFLIVLIGGFALDALGVAALALGGLAIALAPAGWIVRYSLRVRAASLAPSAVD